MKLPRFAPQIALICACSALVGAGFVSAAPAPAQQTDRYKEFRQKFKELMTINGADELAKLVKAFPDEALKRVDGMCAEMARGNNDELEAEFQAMAKAWKTAFKTGFVDKSYEFHSSLQLDAPRKFERNKTLDAFYVTLDRFSKNSKAAKDHAAYEACGAEFLAQADKLEEVGDLRFAGWAAGAAGECFDESVRGAQANPRKACELYGRAIKDFEKVELTGYSYYMRLRDIHAELARGGFDVPEAAPGDPASPEAGTPAPAAAANATAIVAPTTFEQIASQEQFIRPSYFNDEIYQIWPLLVLQDKGSVTKLGAVEKAPQVVRSDSAKIGLDFDNDKKAERTVGMTGNLTPVELELGPEGEKRKWAFAFKTGIQDDTFQGLKTNLSPDDRQALIYYVNAASVVTTINGVQVRVLDDNLDGIYGSAPLTYAYQGLSANLFQPDMDAIVIGDSKRARPWSQLQEIGGQWYDLATDKGGLELRATPMQVQTGTLKLEFKGPAPNWVIVKGEGTLEHCYFDLVNDAKKPIAVPAGTYQLLCGEIRQGKKQQVVKALIMKGSRTPPYAVKAGQETVVALGAPFGFEFETKVEEEFVTVKGPSITITGVAGERYERPWNCAPRPEVSVRKAGAKKGGKGEKMDIVGDLAETKEDGTYRYTMADTWRPVDTPFPIKKGEAVEVQLVEKKNRLFGEIESVWK